MSEQTVYLVKTFLPSGIGGPHGEACYDKLLFWSHTPEKAIARAFNNKKIQRFRLARVDRRTALEVLATKNDEAIAYDPGHYYFGHLYVLDRRECADLIKHAHADNPAEADRLINHSPTVISCYTRGLAYNDTLTLFDRVFKTPDEQTYGPAPATLWTEIVGPERPLRESKARLLHEMINAAPKAAA